MSQTDLKFFTNEPDRTLYERFSVALEKSTQFFDVLVGYFRTSGFFRLYPAMEDIEKIRILVGLNVNKYTVEIINKATAFTIKEATEAYENTVKDEFEHSDTSADIERGVAKFIEWLKSGKLEMRMYTKQPIHAKVYIIRKDQEHYDSIGSVITGSSNFSEAGLVDNLEFNVELRDDADVNFAKEKFEELWQDGMPIKDAFIDTVEKRTWLRGDITPYQLYLKTLYEFFKEEINTDKENFQTLLPEGYIRLQYQIDAVTQARQKLEAYNGVFISDVVGLGKTYICAMLANTFSRNSYKLIICPPVLVNYWRSVLQEFDVARCDVESLGKLENIIEKGTSKYSYVFVDEAHRFRNSDTEGFKNLHTICRGKKVILISATPINNYSSDIENQIYLFQAKQGGTINGIKNLDGFFRGLRSKLAKFQDGSPDYIRQLSKNSEEIRDKLLREVMIRRTRSEIEQYYKDDLEKQGLKFPKVGTPEKIIYEFDDQTDETFQETIEAIRVFSYARYTPLLYLKDQKKYSSMITAQHNMSGFMKGILVKRLESSFYAFKKTLGRFIESYEKFIDMAKGGKVYISKKVNIYDLLDSGDDAKLLYHIEQQDVMEFKTTEFELRFMRDLENDLSQLKYLRDIWNQIDSDPKLDEFRKALMTNRVLRGKKVIVFTESKETAEYLCENLKDIYGDQVVFFSGQSSQALKAEIEDSFNPSNKDHNNDKYDLLITTDVLAEGINLHRANVVVNYDLPWNPTRIMQRVGRINRVGTEADRIFIFNFFPTAQSKKHMPLEARILEKLEAFHNTLGDDYKYLSDDEHPTPQKLFSDLNKDMGVEEESTNPELAYLEIIRRIRDNDTQLFAQIKQLPKKAKAGKLSNLVESSATVGFIRKGALKTFFLSDSEQTKQLTFMEAINYIKAAPDDPKINVGHEYYDHYDKNSDAFDDMLLVEDEVSSEKGTILGNDKKVINLLKAMRNEPRMTDDQIENIDLLLERLENGEIPAKISKDIIKCSKVTEDVLELYYEIMRQVPSAYFEEKNQKRAGVSSEKQVILSAYLKNEG